MIDDIEQLDMIAIVLLRLLYLIRYGIGLVLLMGARGEVGRRAEPAAGQERGGSTVI